MNFVIFATVLRNAKYINDFFKNFIRKKNNRKQKT